MYGLNCVNPLMLLVKAILIKFMFSHFRSVIIASNLSLLSP